MTTSLLYTPPLDSPHNVVTPGVQFSPILRISSANFLLVIFFPTNPEPGGGECSSGSKNGFCSSRMYAVCIALKTYHNIVLLAVFRPLFQPNPFSFALFPPMTNPFHFFPDREKKGEKRYQKNYSPTSTRPPSTPPLPPPWLPAFSPSPSSPPPP